MQKMACVLYFSCMQLHPELFKEDRDIIESEELNRGSAPSRLWPPLSFKTTKHSWCLLSASRQKRRGCC